MRDSTKKPSTGEALRTSEGFTPARFLKSPLLIPFLMLAALVVFNLVIDPAFFRITVVTNNAGYPSMQGRIVSILNNGSELAILAIGMTLVTAASGGQDISVGAVSAIAGAVILRVICGDETAPLAPHAPILLALLASIAVAMCFGAFNGALVSVFKIQPMVATLILFTAGRQIAYWIGGGKILNAPGYVFKYFGNNIPGIAIPTPIFITIACLIVVALLLKFTSLGLYAQTVGINIKSARLNGLNPTWIKMMTYIIMGVCVAIVGFIKVSRTGNINYDTLAKDIEMDAILAVAIGGNALGGGKFNLTGSIAGAYIIQFLTNTLYATNVSSDSLKAYKAIVIIIIVVIGSPVLKEYMGKLWQSVSRLWKKLASEAAQGV
ncbi:sugar ABC transporter permease [Clostridia bacterium]|nr:sugar ABC transporter permease [Clostridia bacterium]